MNARDAQSPRDATLVDAQWTTDGSAWRIEQGDCVERMRELTAASIDAVVTDPPYGLEFMGNEWDRLSAQPGYVERGRITDRPDAQVPYGCGGGVNSYQAGVPMQEWHTGWAREALRVLKPGGHLLAFGGTRTFHRLACALEDAGFEIRDCLMWLYGSGFPKSRNLDGEWAGWGTALKPGWEPIVVARKPLDDTVARNVLKHATGAINVEACRIHTGEDLNGGTYLGTPASETGDGWRMANGRREFCQPRGRWPGNVVLSHSEDCVLVGEHQVRADGHFPAKRGASGYESAASNGGGLKGQDGCDERSLDGETTQLWACVPGCSVRMLDDQGGELVSGANPTRRGSDKFRTAYGDFEGQRECAAARGVDRGGVSRFFYCAKTSRAERNAGVGASSTPLLKMGATPQDAEDADWGARNGNAHPTVKPIELMRWLVRLVTPPGGVVLDCFTGSGTTGCAAVLEGFEFLGIEREPEYLAIAEARIRWWAAHPEGIDPKQAMRRDQSRRKVADMGQLALEVAS